MTIEFSSLSFRYILIIFFILIRLSLTRMQWNLMRRKYYKNYSLCSVTKERRLRRWWWWWCKRKKDGSILNIFSSSFSSSFSWWFFFDSISCINFFLIKTSSDLSYSINIPRLNSYQFDGGWKKNCLMTRSTPIAKKCSLKYPVVSISQVFVNCQDVIKSRIELERQM